MKSPNDIEYLVKQANILGRLYRGSKGLLRGGAKGALLGAGLGAGAALTGGAGLAAALGAGGAGMLSGAKTVGAIRGVAEGAGGLFSKSPNAAKALEEISAASPMLERSIPASLKVPRGLPIAAGAGAGYLLSDEDNKMVGTGIGALLGLAAKPAIVRALKRRAGM